MNENEAMNDDHDDLFGDDELMKKVSKAPEFPPAQREQVEETWQAIAAHVETHPVPAPSTSRPVHAAPVSKLPAWLESLFPAAPDWSWQFAKVAALLVIGFGAAWIAAGQGWLPGAATSPAVTDLPVVADATPDRAWLAMNDHGSRLEALLLGVTRGDVSSTGAVVPAAREVSRELLNDNRIFQRVAQRNDDADLAELLSRIEVVLIALATAPEGQEQEVINTLREFIDESDVLGELREAQSSVPQMARPRVATTTGS